MQRLLLLFLPLGLALGAAELRLHPLFSDGAVLQRDLPVPVWGQATPGERILVRFGDHEASTTVTDSGWWLATLPALTASAEPRDLVVSGTASLTVRNLLVGDVWLASGQSNMDSPLRSGSAAEALPTATDPALRFFIVKKDVAAAPRAFPKDGQWQESEPTAARNFSAVAYFFAREIRRTQGIPVGIIQSSWGGTPIRTWMSVASLRAAPAIEKTVAEWESALARHQAVKDQPELMERYYVEMKEWEDTVDKAYRTALKDHPAAVEAAKAAGLPPPPAPQRERPEPVMPDPMAYPAASKRPQTPAVTFNAMIAPLVPYALKGVLWYQGEADVSRHAEYRVWLPRLIESWRATWGQGDFPFLIVQLPGHGKDPAPVATSGIPFLREAQASALRLPATGLAVTADIGDAADVHPDNKLHVAQRLALVAREKVYGEPIAGVSPTLASAGVEGDRIRLRFSDVGAGLVIGTPPWRAQHAAPATTERLAGFYLAGADRRWVEAEAVIEGHDTVIVSSPAVPAPVAVRYGWAFTPQMNLFTRAGVPAAPFRTDDWNR